ncbi:MAG: hypothetical protein IJ275_03700 [Ruminococcus sp.]|nr:hypothetical protein [Ruminococcus sp.]
MSEFNFDKMRNLNIPDEWAENTIKTVNELKRPTKNKSVRPLRTAIYLSLLIVFIVMMLTFSLPQSNVGIDVVKESYSDETKNKSGIVYKPTEIDEKSESLPFSKTEETESRVEEESSNFDNDVEVKETEKVIETQEKPTRSPKPTLPAVPTEDETKEPEKNNHDYYITITLNNDKLTGDGNIYCITTCNGVNTSGSELNSKEHEVEIVEHTKSTTTVRYYPYRQGVVKTSGYNLYVFSFCNEDGVNIAEMGIYLDN